MSNSLIPYSFTPGTKAKAQEVNANFIALATQIEENKEYVTEKIQETIESVNSDKADKKLLNTSLITNCIVEAPNGVIEYSGNSITIKSGLKVLIPDGPYVPMKDSTYLPADKPTLDGTFWVDKDGKPYMVYCYEWLQALDGTIEKIELKPDLSGTIGEGKLLFRASE